MPPLGIMDFDAPSAHPLKEFEARESVLRDKYSLIFRPINKIQQLVQEGSLRQEELLIHIAKFCEWTQLLVKDPFLPQDREEFLNLSRELKTLPFDVMKSFMVMFHDDYCSSSKDGDHYDWEDTRLNRVILRMNASGLKDSFRKKKQTGQPPARVTELDCHTMIREELEGFYGVKAHFNEGLAGVNLRPIPLIVGPSGVGKTHAVRHWVRSKDLPLLHLNPGCWNVTGSRSGQFTLSTVQEFVRTSDGHGVIFFDELDKYSCLNSDWSRAVQQELYAILDGRLDHLSAWGAEDAILLQRVFMVGAGTWQEEFKQKDKTDVLDDQTSIPEELLYRFNRNVIFTGNLTRDDFTRFLKSFWAEVLMEKPAAGELEILAIDAEKTRHNYRWIEAFVGDHARGMLEVKARGVDEYLRSLSEENHPSQ